jgi:hypothetical protein
MQRESVEKESSRTTSASNPENSSAISIAPLHPLLRLQRTAGNRAVQRMLGHGLAQAKLRAVKEEMRRRMHQSIPEQGEWLCQVVRGFFAYHAVPSNLAALNAFRHHVERIWLRTLRRRSQKQKPANTPRRQLAIAGSVLSRPSGS